MYLYSEGKLVVVFAISEVNLDSLILASIIKGPVWHHFCYQCFYEATIKTTAFILCFIDNNMFAGGNLPLGSSWSWNLQGPEAGHAIKVNGFFSKCWKRMCFRNWSVIRIYLSNVFGIYTLSFLNRLIPNLRLINMTFTLSCSLKVLFLCKSVISRLLIAVRYFRLVLLFVYLQENS